MSLISRLESRFGRFAVPNLTVFLIAGQVICYVMAHFSPAAAGRNLLASIRLVPEAVFAGEYWRLITFLFDPPTNAIFAFIAWYLFYLMGTTLESTWGAFRYNVYLLIGYFASLALASLAWLVVGVPGQFATNAFLYGSVFLAFAKLYPDFTLHLFFILPVKIKWLALLTWIGYAWTVLFGPWLSKAMVIAAVLNFLLFFGRDLWRDMKHGQRRMRHQARVLKSQPRIVHTCRVCGLSSDDAPRVQFRYCSQCQGQCCYCPDHIRDHEHVVKETASQGQP